MLNGVELRVDSLRLCGWRREGNYYLITSGEGRECGHMPLNIYACPTCGEMARPNYQGHRHIDVNKFFGQLGNQCEEGNCGDCPLAMPRRAALGVALLMWSGGKYKRPDLFVAEAKRLGVSRLVNGIPDNFKVGHSWVFMAHRQPAPRVDLFTHVAPTADNPQGLRPLNEKENPLGAVFYVFKPNAIEYVVKEGDTQAKIDKLRARGVTCVHVVRDIDQEQPGEELSDV